MATVRMIGWDMDLVQAKNSFIISERVLSRLRYLLFSWSLCCSLVLQGGKAHCLLSTIGVNTRLLYSD